MLDDEDLVGAANGCEPVRDDDRRTAVQQPVERLLDQDLRWSVDVRRRLVEDQDAGISEERACDRDQLPLASREAGAALAHDVVESLLEACGHAVDADRRRGLAHLFVGRVGTGETDVVRDRAGEQEGILEHDAELAPVTVQLQLAEVCAVHRDRSVVGVVEAADQLGSRRFAAARLPDEGEAAPRRNVDVDPVQHRFLAVGEGDVVEAHVALDPAGRRRARLVADLRLLVEDERDLLHRRPRGLHLAVEI